ncbi:AarF/ABC1/UbiB kinase family protein [Paenibacillus glucanolyticus]|nr:AarF/ABC1/UbiB kinase family protein [Paenibacillus glucanolyticus]
MSTLARNSLGYAVDELRSTGNTRFKKEGEGELAKGKNLGARIRLALEQLGPTFVKLGQIASTRPDLLPADIIVELQKLQDHVKPFSYSEAAKLVESEFHAPISEIFLSFSEQPLAAASIGQVHRAVLKNGTQVIVKIQRPGIQGTIEADLDILAEWARISEGKMNWAKHYRLRDAVDELSNALLRELNYLEEARNAEKMKTNNMLSYVLIPDVYWDFTTKRVLTMEYVDGVPLSDHTRLTDTDFDRKQLAQRIATAIFSQILENGFFHADPHPGNVMALPDGKVAFLDFGMVGKLPNHLKKHFVSFVIALRNQSTKGVIRAISQMGVIPDDADRDKLYEDVDELRQKYYDVPLKQVSVGVAVQDLFRVAYSHRIRIPSEMTMLGKSMLTMEGVATALDPDISVIDVAEPFGKKLFLDRINPFELGKQVFEEIPDYFDLIREAPQGLRQLVKVMRQGKLQIEANSPQLGELHSKLDRIVNRLSFSIVLLALSIVMLGLIIGAAISGTSSPIIGKVPIVEIGFLIALLMVLWLLFAIFRSGRF